MPRTRCLLALTCLLGIVNVDATYAAAFTVGSGASCNFRTVQEAIDRAANTPDSGMPHEIRIVSGAHQRQALRVTNRSLTISGGWRGCADFVRDGVTQLLGTAADPVLTVRNNQASVASVRLLGLDLRYGGGGSDGLGGGVDARGRVNMTLEGTTVAGNNARAGGGGIYFEGPSSGFGGILTLLAGTSVHGNRITQLTGSHGGGVFVREAHMRMRSDGVEVRNNSGAQFGGGIAIHTGTLTVGSFGEPETSQTARGARVSNNQAGEGGGIWLGGADGRGSLLSASELAVEFNIASYPDYRPPNGGGIYADDHSEVYLQRDSVAGPAVQCPAGDACLRLLGNRVGENCTTPSSGAGGAIYLTGSRAAIRQTLIQDNCSHGGAIHNHTGHLELEGVLLVGNRIRTTIAGNPKHLIATASASNSPDPHLSLRHVTVWNNLDMRDTGAITARAVNGFGPGTLEVLASAFDSNEQPSVIQAGACNRAGLPAAAFADPAAGDFRPSAAGPLADACATGTVPTTTRDPLLTPRCIDLPHIDRGGPCDIGAVEAASQVGELPQATTATLTFTPNVIYRETPVQIRVTVAGTTSAPTGGSVVVNTSNGRSCTTAALTPATATTSAGECSLNFGISGNFTLQATYSGAGVHQASQSEVYPVQVQRRPSTVRITGRTPMLPRAGQTYTVELDIADTLVASGTIRVEDGAGNHCNAVLQSGRAHCSLSSPAGLHTLQAHYEGDAGYLPSSTSVAQPVQGTSDLALAIAASPIAATGSIEYEVMVTNLGPDPAFQAPTETSLSDAVRMSSRRCDVLSGASCVLDEASADRARVDLPVDAVARLRITAQVLDRHRHGAFAQINPSLPDADPDVGNNMDWVGPGAPHPDRVFLDSFE